MGVGERARVQCCTRWSAGPLEKVHEQSLERGREGAQRPVAGVFLMCSGNSKEASVAATDEAEKTGDEVRELIGARGWRPW